MHEIDGWWWEELEPLPPPFLSGGVVWVFGGGGYVRRKGLLYKEPLSSQKRSLNVRFPFF